MTELSSQINLITCKLSKQLNALEQEYQRWSDYKTDYDALENQLKTLPDNTTKSAMIPLGKLAFMPGKLIHTNEILVLLGDQYYAERSAKQAVEILGRRRQIVDENMRLAEAQMNSFRAKKSSILDASALTTSDPQMNEEGLPIMEIREPIDEKEEEKKQKQLLERNKKLPQQQPTNQLPESVLRARKMMEEADNQKKKLEKDDQNKALFDLLRDLEQEEEEEQGIQGEEKAIVSAVTGKKNDDDDDDDQDSDESRDHSSDDDEKEDDERYDTEISENMFDRFGDDEQYPLDGVIDQEDFTCYSELPPDAATLGEIINGEDEELYEKSTPKVITKKKVLDPAASEQEQAPAPKKMSKFKLAQQEKKNNSPPSSPLKQDPIIESATPVDDEAPKKKFSKFKVLRQQQTERPTKPVAAASASVATAVAASTPIPNEDEEEEEGGEELILDKSDRVIPQVASAGSIKPKKMSRFKLQRAQSKQHAEPTATTSLAAEPIKPKRSVTWNATTDVRDHDYNSAPSDVSETLSYSQPMKLDSKPSLFKQKITSAADIFSTIKHTQGEIVDDYPSLDDDDDDARIGEQVNLNELIQVARDRSETLYRSGDGSQAPLPIIKHIDEDEDEEEQEEKPNGIIVARKNKLDNKIMKGAVMERDSAPVDLEQVEDDMDLKEITSSYQQKRQSMLAVTGGFTFAPKPEFEVVDEDLPLPKRKNDKQEEQQQAVPRKMSRFKAARLGMQMDETDDNY